MHRTLKIILILLTINLSHNIWGQSAVYIYKNPINGKGDFMVYYGINSKNAAEYLCKTKLLDQGYENSLIEKYASTDQKGFGMVIKSKVALPYRKKGTIYGAALGCSSEKEAELKAFDNLRKFNPEWINKEYQIVIKFEDK